MRLSFRLLPAVLPVCLALACGDPSGSAGAEGAPSGGGLRPIGGGPAGTATPAPSASNAPAPTATGGPPATSPAPAATPTPTRAPSPTPTPSPTRSALDPAPAATTPGEHVTAACPHADETEFELDAGAATTHRFVGRVPGVDAPGTFYIAAAPGEEIVGPLETGPNGDYDLSAPLFCGAQIVKLTWSGPGGCTTTLVYDVTSGACTKLDLRITLMWDELGRDFELHLVRPGGRINDTRRGSDCTWNTCRSADPPLDWGVEGDPSDDPRKDVDDVNAYGPESIYLSGLESGAYTVLVEHWGDGSPDADGTVILNTGGRTHVVSRADLAPRHVWTVGTIDGRSGAFTAVDAERDCSRNWNAGCLDQIP